MEVSEDEESTPVASKRPAPSLERLEEEDLPAGRARAQDKLESKFTVVRHRKVELPPSKLSEQCLLTAGAGKDAAGDLRRHSSVSDVPLDSNVLRKVASLTLDKATIEQRVSRPKFIPEKLNFQLYEKFEGQMLINWLVSAFGEDNYLRGVLKSQDFKLLAAQFCTHLLAAGVLRQLPDKDVPQTETLFRPDLIYYWSHTEAVNTSSQKQNDSEKNIITELARTVQEQKQRIEELERMVQENERSKTLADIQSLVEGVKADFESPTKEKPVINGQSGPRVQNGHHYNNGRLESKIISPGKDQSSEGKFTSILITERVEPDRTREGSCVPVSPSCVSITLRSPSDNPVEKPSPESSTPITLDGSKDHVPIQNIEKSTSEKSEDVSTSKSRDTFQPPDTSPEPAPVDSSPAVLPASNSTSPPPSSSVADTSIPPTQPDAEGITSPPNSIISEVSVYQELIDVTMFIVKVSQHLAASDGRAGVEDSESVTVYSVLKDATNSYFTQRDCLIPVKLFSGLFALNVPLLSQLASKLPKYAFDPSVPSYRQSKALEFLILFWKNNRIVNNPSEDILEGLQKMSKKLYKASAKMIEEPKGRIQDKFFNELKTAFKIIHTKKWLADIDLEQHINNLNEFHKTIMKTRKMNGPNVVASAEAMEVTNNETGGPKSQNENELEEGSENDEDESENGDQSEDDSATGEENTSEINSKGNENGIDTENDSSESQSEGEEEEEAEEEDEEEVSEESQSETEEPPSKKAKKKKDKKKNRDKLRRIQLLKNNSKKLRMESMSSGLNENVFSKYSLLLSKKSASPDR